MRKVYLDMDGVLADFNRSISEKIGSYSGDTYIQLPEDQWTPEQIERDRHVKAAMCDPLFWRDMHPMSDAHVLWDYAKQFDMFVLTARPKLDHISEMVREEKTRWLHRHFLFTSHDHIHVCLRSEKILHAAPTSVLVDDMLKNCQEWDTAGGIAIHHSDARSSIKILSEIAYD